MSRNYRVMLIGITLIILILLVFWRVQHFEFLNYDDQIYVTDNVQVRQGLTLESVKWAFTSDEAGFWHPLTWLSLMLDYELYRLNPGGYHWTNLLFHIAGTFLLFWGLYRMTGEAWCSGLVAALFAVHPLHVESVAWVAERKDVLSSFFWMATIAAYIWFTERPVIGRYMAVVIIFIFGLMSKPMLVTMPFVLLLLDYWPLNRFPRPLSHNYGLSAEAGPEKNSVSLLQLLIEKAPLLFLAVMASILVFTAQIKFHALSSLDAFPLDSRVANALVSYTGYIIKTFWPKDLSVFYPHPGYWPMWKVVLSGLALLTAGVSAYFASKRYPYVAVGWLWYLGVLIPVIGLVQIGSFAMADRFSYLSIIGIFIIVVWGLKDLINSFNRPKYVFHAAGLVALAFLSVFASKQVDYWQNDATLFTRAMEVTRNNYKAMHVLGMSYNRQGNHALAIKYLTESIRQKPDDSSARNDLGIVYIGQKRFREAEKELNESLRIKPDNFKALNNLGVSLALQGKKDEALAKFREALKLQPEYKNAQDNMAKILGNSH